MLTVKAYGDNLIVTPIEEEKKGVLIVPTKDKPIYWKVLSVGNKVENIKMDDEVVLSPHSSHIIHEKERIFAVSADYVLAVR